MYTGMKSQRFEPEKKERSRQMSGNSLQDKCVKCDWPAGEEEKEVERWSKDCWIEDRDKKMKLEKTKDLTGQQEARRKQEH